MSSGGLVVTWDTPGATWDSGLDWDSNLGPSPGDISPWTALVTSEHSDKPKFMAMLAAVLQPFADTLAVVQTIPGLFDLDVAVGQQLDFTGQWVGISRDLSLAISGVYFSFDTPGVGFDQGVWYTPGDPIGAVSILPDDQYRTLLRARVVANHWDGSIPGAYSVWDTEFVGTGWSIKIHDLDNMHMIFELTGPPPDALTRGLLLSGYLSVRPAGVQIDSYIFPT